MKLVPHPHIVGAGSVSLRGIEVWASDQSLHPDCYPSQVSPYNTPAHWDNATLTRGVHRTHTPRKCLYGIDCYNYSSSANSATPRDWLHHINTPCIEHGAIESTVWTSARSDHSNRHCTQSCDWDCDHIYQRSWCAIDVAYCSSLYSTKKVTKSQEIPYHGESHSTARCLPEWSSWSCAYWLHHDNSVVLVNCN